jgi:DNA modification methylase
MITLHNGDCLEEQKNIKDGSVDLILCDPPYGTVKDLSLDGWNNQKTHWDIAINPQDIFAMAEKKLRMNGKMILFSQEPYTSKLIQSSFENIEFCYRMVWKKDHFANALTAKKAPVSYYEDILVFYKKWDLQLKHPLRSYFEKVLSFIGLTLKQIENRLGHRKAEHCFYISSSQFGIPTDQVYKELIDVFSIDQMNGFLSYDEIKEKNKTSESIFNLWEGNKYKSNVLEYSKDYQGLHPTQKPVLLLEDLIKTYSNDGDTILDFTMGSGSTGIACWNTNRSFIGIEKDSDYFAAAKKRLEDHQKQLRLF